MSVSSFLFLIMSNLTDKQEAYCQAYVVCGNQSAAYRIGFEAESMNVNTVAVEACRLHADPNITLRIRELQNDAWARNKVTLDELIQDLAAMARFDIRELYDDETGALLPLKKMPLAARQMISQLDTEEMTIEGVVIGQVRKIRTISRLDAVEKLMKHLGGYEKDNKQKSQVNTITFKRI